MITELFFFFIASFVALFSIVDPMLVVPVFATLTRDYSHEARILTAKRATLYVFGVLLLFFIAGGLILKFFGISLEGVRIAGGVMIINTAMEMLHKQDRLQPDEQRESEAKDDIAFSPLAMPILSGPGAIAVIIGLTTDAKSWYHYPIILLALIMICVLCYWTMRLSPLIAQRMGTTMMNSFTRIMGFILLCIGIQYIVNGILPLIKGVFHT